MKNNQFSRRHFLGSMLAAAGASAAPFAMNLAAMSAAAAQNASDYKATVCLFMTGGNDPFNTVVATDPASWSEYQRLRGGNDNGQLALPAPGASNGLLAITPNTEQSGRSFALHPSLAPLKTLFDSGRAAIVANVGTLVQPTTLAQYKAASVALPPKLFSHNDQQSVWQSGGAEGATSGWGGRMADLVAAGNGNAMFTSISAGGNTVFLSGRNVRQFQVNPAGNPPVELLSGQLFHSSPAGNTLQSIITASSTDPMEKEYAAIMQRAIASQGVLASAIPAAGAGGVPDPTPYINPNTQQAAVNPLAKQLQMVARIIAGRNGLGAKRQVFYVSMAGFDTHNGQLAAQADLLARVAHAIAYFDTLMGNLQGTDVRRQVTLFTASDFGRTFASNGDGTDHGWGSHHFVVGGAVKGKDIYGAFPPSGEGHALDVGSGSLLPTVSVDQYGATLAGWFGLSAAQIADVFPNIGNFSSRDLGFMNA
ncbi:Uncharacterized conserved protein, DUF1501 family [Duganella sacchari]|uniref:Uncharacterized conserved protein, DUF1501 family n=1 Tax=Duganella sacchari TaxID=551987 RepID=A0A1M7RC98_9BURK|nr:DUF1501 domain-containing protein [Duganella sacchari]SHN43907.1 Uncharacterized conserved protein, DUF1501 family [Duganella sacchari]